MPEYLSRRGTRYYAQFPIPKDLRSRIDPAPIKISLRTGRKVLAKEIIFKSIGQVRQIFLKAGKMKTLKNYPVRVLVQSCLDGILGSFGQIESQKIYGNLSEDKIHYHKERLSNKLNEITEDLRTGNLSHAQEQVDTLADEVEIEPTIMDKGILFGFLKDQQALLAKFLKNLDGNYIENFHPEQIREQARQELKKEADQFLVRDLIKEYIEKNVPDTKLTRQQYDNYAHTLLECMGKDVLISEMDHAKANKFIDEIRYLPKNRNKLRAYKNKSFSELIEMKLDPEKCIKPKTQAHYLTFISTFFNWCVCRGYTTQNFFTGKKIKVSGVANTCHFSDSQLHTIFTQHQITKSKSTKHSIFFIPLIATYTGARLGELAQLTTRDIFKNEYGQWVLSINEENGKSCKTKASIRKIPIHPDLVSFGIPNLVKYAKANDSKKIFFDDKSRTGKPGQYVGKTFNEGLPALHLKPEVSGNRLVFHSFRSTIETMLRRNNADQRYIDAYIGHNEGTISANHYFGGGYTVQNLTEHILPYIKIDLHFLSNHKWIKKMLQY